MMQQPQVGMGMQQSQMGMGMPMHVPTVQGGPMMSAFGTPLYEAPEGWHPYGKGGKGQHKPAKGDQKGAHDWNADPQWNKWSKTHADRWVGGRRSL